MKRLNFGAGQNRLPAPWENYDIELDITKPLPFDIGSTQFILAEHVIEHVPFAEGFSFLRECFRILQPGGVLRLAFPDITREVHPKIYNTLFSRAYTRRMVEPADVWLSTLIDWEHKSCWTRDMAWRVLMAVGFEPTQVPYGQSAYSELDGIDGHHKACGIELALAETTIFEAVR